MAGHWLHMAILLFFAIGWVLNQVVTKEQKPGPPLRRPIPPPGTRDPSLRFGQPTPVSADPRRPAPLTKSNAAVSNDIMIIRAENSKRPAARPPQPQPQPRARQQTPASSQAGRRPARPRPPGTSSKRPEPQNRTQFLTDAMPSQSIEQRPSGGLPSMTAVAAAASQASRATQATSIAPMTNITTAPPLPITLAVTAALNDRDRMREALILTELLSLPKALKQRRPHN